MSMYENECALPKGLRILTTTHRLHRFTSLACSL
ncbi:predicted protein [Botrytis cinerea T4]|uniref:Uncharacterized protein n=1 Tax=Botryotinia fuckeliana (strain T4) TaxID=999810 RepID=G2XUA2_BOTF4|nr:predicted protein [Botrytis cinerea T4]